VEKVFEFIDPATDIGSIVYGSDMKQIFANAARGLFNLIIEFDNMTLTESREIQVTDRSD
jgi:SHS2 domain-containing protein